MISIEIKGKIQEILPKLYLDEDNDFRKQKVYLECEKEILTIIFVDDKSELLKYCRHNQEVIIKVYLKGKIWYHKGNQYTANELKCYSLKIVKNNDFDIFPIEYNGSLYGIKRVINEQVASLNLYNLQGNEELEISLPHIFPDKKINADHILYDVDKFGEEILSQIVEKGIVTIDARISSNGYNGVICKILVCDLFDSQGILYNYSPEERLKYTMKSLIKSLNEE